MLYVHNFDKDPMHLRIGFMATLNPDVIPFIFSYLTRKDCLTCMQVCRAWYQVVPHYSQKFWETIKWTPFDVDCINKSLERCLGDHVKNVIFDGFDDEEQLHCMMQRVLDWGCTKIKSLEFISCKTVDQDEFLKLLEKLAVRLTRIKMMHHNSNIAFLYVFHACPELTDFTFQINSRGTAYAEHSVYSTEPVVYQIPPPPSNMLTRIKYLCLDIMMDKQLRLEPILQRCPELLSFVGASWSARPLHFSPSYNDISVHLATLFFWCPKLTFLESNCSYNYYDDVQDIYLRANDDGLLRHFSACEDYGQDRLAGYLTRHQETLEFVSLWRYNRNFEGLNWSPIFRSLRLTHLQTLICYDIMLDAISVVTMLNYCFVLETLVLEGEPLMFDGPSIQSLATMRHLRTLKCFRIELDDELSLLTFLERFPGLEKLFMISPFIPVKIPQHVECPKQLKHVDMSPIAWKVDAENANVEEAVAQFFQCLISGLKIEVIRLIGIPRLGGKVLLAVTNMPTLRTLDVQLDETLESIQEHACHFALQLHNTLIERLTLWCVRDLPLVMLEALGDLPLLSQINVTRPRHPHMPYTRIHAKGLIEMLRKSKRLENLCFSACSIQEDTDILSYNELAERVKGVPGFVVKSGYEKRESTEQNRLVLCELTIGGPAKQI